jgi:hypothetical protein
MLAEIPRLATQSVSAIYREADGLVMPTKGPEGLLCATSWSLANLSRLRQTDASHFADCTRLAAAARVLALSFRSNPVREKTFAEQDLSLPGCAA